MSLIKALRLIEGATGHIEAAGELRSGGRFFVDEVGEAKRALSRALGELDRTEEQERQQVGSGF